MLSFLLYYLSYIFYVSDYVKENVFAKCIFVFIYLTSGDINISDTWVLTFYSKTIFRVIYKYSVVYILAHICKCINVYTCIHILNLWAFCSGKLICSRVMINNKIYWFMDCWECLVFTSCLMIVLNHWIQLKGEYNLLWLMLRHLNSQ